MTPEQVIAEARALGAPEELIKQYEQEQGLAPAPEPFAKELELMRQAAEMGAPQHLIDEYAAEKGIDAYRAQLEQQLARDVQTQRGGDAALNAATDTPTENAIEYAQGLKYGAYQGATGLVDFFTSPIRGAYNYGVAEMFDLPKTSGIKDLLGEMEYKGPEEPFLRGLSTALGEAPLMAGGFASVAGRNLGTAAGAAAELAGFGMAPTQAGILGGSRVTADALHELTADALKNRIPIEQMTQINLNEPTQVKYWANRINDDIVMANNLRNVESQDAYDASVKAWQAKAKAAEKRLAAAETPKQVKAAEKMLAKVDEELAGLEAPSLEGPEYSLLSVMNTAAERFGLKPEKFRKALQKAGGMDEVGDLSSVIGRTRLRQSQEMFQSDKGASKPTFFEKTVRPVVGIVRDKVGRGAAADFERAFESAARNNENLLMYYAARSPEVAEVRQWMDSADIKAAFLDLQFTGKAGMDEIVATAGRELSSDGQEVFKQLLSDVRKHNVRARRLYKDGVLKDEEFWPSSLLRADPQDAASQIKADQQAAKTMRPTNVAGAQVRLRGPIAEAEDADLTRYENPFKAAIDRIVAEQNLVELSEKFKLQPMLDLDSTSVDFFNGVEAEMAKRTGKDKAALLKVLMEDTVEGSRLRPSLPLQLFMKQAYAGTLGQFDSALLNLHDIFVSMWRNGAINTAKALKPTLKEMIGKSEDFDIRQMGITNDPSSLEEFRLGFDGIVEQSSDLESMVDAYSRFSFKWSGFQAFDRIGKGVTVRAAFNAFEDAAKKGQLVKKFGYLMEPSDLSKIAQPLKEGKALADMTPAQRKLVEELMFARLGEQQLISMAGRPLNYLRTPWARPFWAMSGFAVKQMDLLKMSIVDEIAKGNFKQAGKSAAGYLAYVALGYALVDTARKLPSYLITGDERKAPTAERLAMRAGEQVAGALTLNKLGGEYDLRQIKQEPYEWLVGTIEPPGGVVQAVSKDAVRLFQEDKDFRGYFFKNIPMVGDFLYDLWNKNS